MDDIVLFDGPFVIAVYALLGIVTAALVAARRRRPGKLSPRRVALVLAIGVAAGAGLGTLLSWLIGDVWDVFGLSLTWVIRIAAVVAFAVVGLAVVGLIVGGRLRRVLAPLAILLSVLALAMTINIDVGAYRTVGALLGHDGITPLTDPVPKAEGTLTDWAPPADMPAQGVLKAVDIPAVTAKFSPRSADVYLPPAALVADPPPLPVVIALSGQPGSPSDVFTFGALKNVLDSIAADHRGVAPIVVVPDQLGAPEKNPMCVDGPLGDSATYLMADVPTWIEANLPATTDHSKWTMAGFSQGGTCTMQLAPAHPELFGSLIDVSGELVPSIGSEADTIAQGFGGDAAAYKAATPEAVIAAHAPYTNYVAYFASGEDDAQFTGYVEQVAALAQQSGMTVTREISPGTGHDWNTARWGLQRGFTLLLPTWGITS